MRPTRRSVLLFVGTMALVFGCRQEVYFLDLENRTTSAIVVWATRDGPRGDRGDAGALERRVEIAPHQGKRIPFGGDDGRPCAHAEVEAELRRAFPDGLTFTSADGARAHLSFERLRTVLTPFSDGYGLAIDDALILRAAQ